MDCTIYVVKTKVLFSCTVTAQLVSAFVLAYAKAGFLMMRLICECFIYKCFSIYLIHKDTILNKNPES